MEMPVPAFESQDHWRREVTACLDAAPRLLPEQFVNIDEWLVLSQERCVAQLWAGGGFRWSARTARGSLGQELMATKDDPGSAWERSRMLVDNPPGHLGQSLANWLSAAGEPVRHAARVSASSRAAELAPLQRASMLWSAHKAEWVPAGKLRYKVSCWVAGSSDKGDRLLSVGPTQEAEVVCAHAALVWVLAQRRLPTVVVRVDPATGHRVSVDITEGRLGGAVERIARSAAAKAAMLSGEAAPPGSPGSQCRWCERIGDCVEGQEWRKRPLEYVGGLPTLRPRRAHE